MRLTRHLKLGEKTVTFIILLIVQFDRLLQILNLNLFGRLIFAALLCGLLTRGGAVVVQTSMQITKLDCKKHATKLAVSNAKALSCCS